MIDNQPHNRTFNLDAPIDYESPPSDADFEPAFVHKPPRGESSARMFTQHNCTYGRQNVPAGSDHDMELVEKQEVEDDQDADGDELIDLDEVGLADTRRRNQKALSRDAGNGSNVSGGSRSAWEEVPAGNGEESGRTSEDWDYPDGGQVAEERLNTDDGQERRTSVEAGQADGDSSEVERERAFEADNDTDLAARRARNLSQHAPIRPRPQACRLPSQASKTAQHRSTQRKAAVARSPPQPMKPQQAQRVPPHPRQSQSPQRDVEPQARRNTGSRPTPQPRNKPPTQPVHRQDQHQPSDRRTVRMEHSDGNARKEAANGTRHQVEEAEDVDEHGTALEAEEIVDKSSKSSSRSIRQFSSEVNIVIDAVYKSCQASVAMSLPFESDTAVKTRIQDTWDEVLELDPDGPQPPIKEKHIMLGSWLSLSLLHRQY